MTEEEQERNYWARVWAKAILNARVGNEILKDKLEKDPLSAYELVRQEFGPRPGTALTHMDLYENDIFEGATKFSEMNTTDLENIIQNGNRPIPHNEFKKKKP
jgi:hypothetical protein